MAVVYYVLESAAIGIHRQFAALVDTTLVLVFGLVLLIVYKIQKWFNDQRQLPPGPFGFPIWGMIPMIKKDFHLFLCDLKKKYSDENGILSLKMGTETFVVLTDWKVIREAFQSDHFIARPRSELSSLLNGYGKIDKKRKKRKTHFKKVASYILLI